jgi:hypothetical protein
MKPWQQRDHALEAELATRYEQTMMKLTDSYMQRVKKQWTKDGDRNTFFFTMPCQTQENEYYSFYQR